MPNSMDTEYVDRLMFSNHSKLGSSLSHSDNYDLGTFISNDSTSKIITDNVK